MWSQVPALAAPSLAHHRGPSPHDLIGLSQPTHRQEVTDPIAMERREVEGIGKRPASASWLYKRLGVPWPSCDGIEDDLDNSYRRSAAAKSPQSGSLFHTLAPPSPWSPPTIRGQRPYSHINSTQPTYRPAMVITLMEREADVERIRGGCPGCCCSGFTIAGPQGKEGGIPITPSVPNGGSQPGQAATAETTMRETISPPMIPHQGASRSRSASHSSPKPGPDAPAESRSRRQSQAQVADGAKQPTQRASRSRTASQAAEPLPRTQSGAKEQRPRAQSVSQPRSRTHSQAGQADSARARHPSHHLSITAPELPPLPSPVTPINLRY